MTNTYHCQCAIRDTDGKIVEYLNIEVQCDNVLLAFDAVNDKMLELHGKPARHHDVVIELKTIQ